MVRSLGGHTSAVRGVWSDQEVYYSGSEDCLIVAWDPLTGKHCQFIVIIIIIHVYYNYSYYYYYSCLLQRLGGLLNHSVGPINRKQFRCINCSTLIRAKLN